MVRRVMIAKPGLDGHDRGAKIVARALRDAGFEVVYTGLHNTPAAIAAAAIQEDVQVVGLSILSGAHMSLVPRVMTELKEQGGASIQVIVGGIIPDADREILMGQGVKACFGPGTRLDEIVAYFQDL